MGFVVCLFFLGNSYLENEKIINRSSNLIAIQEAIKEVSKLWFEGDFSDFLFREKISCSNLELLRRLDNEHLRCNPKFLDCYFESQEKNKRPHIQTNESMAYIEKVNGQYLNVIPKEFSSGIVGPRFGYYLNIHTSRMKNEIYKVLLEDTCHEAYLPQKIYAYGEVDPKKELWTWDNHGRHLFVDKRPVLRSEIEIWKNIGYKLRNDEDFMAASDLSIEEMQLFCASRGKKLLQAHVFDAASFKPVDQGRQFSVPSKLRGRYPWSNKNSKSFLNIAADLNKENEIYQLRPEDCKLAWVKGCPELLPNQDPLFSGSSWTGIFSVIGGGLEVMYNPIEPQKNLKLSGQFLEPHSKWHELGKRVYWSDENRQIQEFGGSDQYLVGFRCMREVFYD